MQIQACNRHIGLAIDAGRQRVGDQRKRRFGHEAQPRRRGAFRERPASHGGGLLGPKGIAIDMSGNAWIANAGGSSVVKLSPTGSVLSGTGGFTGGGIDAPVALALDSQTNVWVANFSGNSVTVLTSTGAAKRRKSADRCGRHRQPNRHRHRQEWLWLGQQ